MANPKIKHTITKKEWNKKHKDFKTIIGGTPYIMMYDDKVGTHLVPVKIVNESIDEAKAGDFEMGDFVHFKSKNKTGMVKKISGDKVTIMTMKGDFTGDIKDVQVLYQDDVDSKIKLMDLLKEASDVEVYHKSYTHAIEAAKAYALKKGYEIEDDEMFTKVGVGSKRPSVGKTTRVSLELMKGGKPQRKMLHIQVYGMKNGYELNAYIN